VASLLAAPSTSTIHLFCPLDMVRSVGPHPHTVPRVAPATQKKIRPSSLTYAERRTLLEAPSRRENMSFNEHRSAFHGIKARLPTAHRPSQMPLSCPVTPPSQREQHKDGGGGGGGVARRARAARAPKATSCATSCCTSSATPCAASLTCWRRRRQGRYPSPPPHPAPFILPQNIH